MSKKIGEYRLEDPLKTVDFLKPQIRESLLAPQTLSADTWTRIVFGGSSIYNQNGLSPDVEWDNVNNHFDFNHAESRAIGFQFDMQFEFEVVSLPAVVDFRFVVESQDGSNEILIYPNADNYATDKTECYSSFSTFDLTWDNHPHRTLTYLAYAGFNAAVGIELRVRHNLAPLVFVDPDLVSCQGFLYEG